MKTIKLLKKNVIKEISKTKYYFIRTQSKSLCWKCIYNKTCKKQGKESIKYNRKSITYYCPKRESSKSSFCYFKIPTNNVAKEI